MLSSLPKQCRSDIETESTVPQIGIRKGGSDQKNKFKSLERDFISGPPFSDPPLGDCDEIPNRAEIESTEPKPTLLYGQFS